jgi:hypothetical protein
MQRLPVRVSNSALGVVIWGFGLSVVALAPRSAAAQDKAPHLLLEPTEYTDVLDAFESADDPIDFDVRLGFVRYQEDAVIERERAAAGGYALDTVDVADYHAVRSALVLGAEVGLYKDLMVYGRLPLVFSDTRELRLPQSARCDSSACQQRRDKIQDVLDDRPDGSGDAAPVFQPDPLFAARTRSGVPAVDAGIAWGILNQYREPGLPTWVVLVEARFGVGAPMKPCEASTPNCDPGLSRGTTRLMFGTRWSYRYRFVEPYLGFDQAFEWATSARAAFEPGGEGPHLTETGLPSITGITAGGAIVPWEQRGKFQQFMIDVRGRAEYVSDGRDYTPLFDALGRSPNPFLSADRRTDAGRDVAWMGLTNVDAYARLALDIALAMQAARYVRFRVALSLAHETRHLLTGAPACTDAPADTPSPDCGDQAHNALYRPVIDAPGQRFLLSSALAYTLSAAATAQF